jgi:transposase
MDNVCCGSDCEGLYEELGRLRDSSREAACLFRICCIHLVLVGHRPGEVGGWLGISERTLRRWVELYQGSGIEGVRRGLHIGRPGHLEERDLAVLLSDIRQSPADAGLEGPEWSGTLVQRYVEDRFGARLGIRQCQRLLTMARREDVPSRAPGHLGAQWPQVTATGPAGIA